MNNRVLKLFAFISVIMICFSVFPSHAFISEAMSDAASNVTAQLESIDSLQTMQNKRSSYSGFAEYNAYIEEMNSQRLAAKEAFDALSDEEKAELDPALVAKLTDTLSTLYYEPTVTLAPREDEYPYQVVFKNRIVYEIGHHVSYEMPCTIILVDTNKVGKNWTPNGLYEYGKSNYEATYCCDAVVPVNDGTHYKRLNLEDSGYYTKSAADHIRAIVETSYPYVTLEEMKESMKANGADSSFVDSLTRGDIISAVQMAIWAYANPTYDIGISEYSGTIEMTNNSIFRNPIHDYTNELWSWWNTKNSSGGVYDSEAAYRVNNLVYYLRSLEPVKAEKNQIVISDIEVARADLIVSSDDLYSIGMHVYLNAGGSGSDELTIKAESYSENTDGTVSVTGTTVKKVTEDTHYGMYVNARYGDTVKVTVEGTQNLGKGVYFYEPEGGREASQCLVSVSEGETPVMVSKAFSFNEDISKGIRVYKTASDTGYPISDITFNIFKVDSVPSGSTPTKEEIDLYATEENKVGSVLTDEAGYGCIPLEDGIYLVTEEPSPDKVIAPVDPFYVKIPLSETVTNDDGSVITETYEAVPLYPKNEPIEDPEEPPETPPVPENVTGTFSILKYEEGSPDTVLGGAKFAVYKTAEEGDTDTCIITCDGAEYTVVPVMYEGSPLFLTTEDDGIATSPSIECGSYFIVETKAPDGYIAAESAFKANVYHGITEEPETVRVSNKKGIPLLPSTGGKGTVMLVSAGGILVTVAVILLVTKKRMKNYY